MDFPDQQKSWPVPLSLTRTTGHIAIHIFVNSLSPIDPLFLFQSYPITHFLNNFQPILDNLSSKKKKKKKKKEEERKKKKTEKDRYFLLVKFHMEKIFNISLFEHFICLIARWPLSKKKKKKKKKKGRKTNLD